MDTITLSIKNKKKFAPFLELLKLFDVVEVQKAKLTKVKKKKRDIFESAGMWEGRDISIEKIRAEAWSKKK
ncbi:MAG: hypothetical protein HY960_10005 [Ignavibacteriae bacterium]|nr:hypothetical protein [Ignavibacteriota bacterium]